MKKLFVLGLLCWSFASHAASTTITGIVLNGVPGEYWTTGVIFSWVLGVSDSPTGPLINNPDKTIANTPLGTYWLFADSSYNTSLGATPELQVYLSNGRVVFISSESAVSPAPEMAHYSATKTMQLGISRSLAELTKGTEATVNCVLSGPTRTASVEQFIQDVFPDLPPAEAERRFMNAKSLT